MTKEDFILSGLLEQYALGVTTQQERLLVEEFLVKYPAMEAELYEIEDALQNYALKNAQRPSPNVKDKLFSQLFPEQNSSLPQTAKVVNIESTNPGSFYKIASAAMLVLLLGSIAFGYYFYNQNQQNQNNLAITQQSLKQQQNLNESLSGNLNIITDKYAQSVSLKGTPQAPEAAAKIFWIKNTGQVYVDSRDLPAAPTGKQYQLWAIVDGSPVDAGMIETKKGKYYIQKMKSFGQAQAFAITLEKSGGSTSPTMEEMVVISSM